MSLVWQGSGGVFRGILPNCQTRITGEKAETLTASVFGSYAVMQFIQYLTNTPHPNAAKLKYSRG